jgi:caffeoyl-CoA O-methyltransferase
MATHRTGAWIDDRLVAYAADHSTPPHDVVSWITEQTAARAGRVARMQIGSDQSSFLTLLTAAIGTRHAIEIGTFTGTSSVAIGRGLAAHGRLVCFDINADWTSIAVEAWRRAGLADRIELRLGDALTNLADHLNSPADSFADPVDLVFIDADKTNYGNYLEAVLPALRPGGIVVVDNTLWSGAVLDDDVIDADTVALRAFNDACRLDPRFDVSLLTIGDGVTLLRKR